RPDVEQLGWLERRADRRPANRVADVACAAHARIRPRREQAARLVSRILGMANLALGGERLQVTDERFGHGERGSLGEHRQNLVVFKRPEVTLDHWHAGFFLGWVFSGWEKNTRRGA